MNKERRQEIEAVTNELVRLMYRVQDLQEEEEEYRDNIPENLQGSERYEKADDAASALEEAADYIQDAIDSLDEASE